MPGLAHIAKLTSRSAYAWAVCCTVSLCCVIHTSNTCQTRHDAEVHGWLTTAAHRAGGQLSAVPSAVLSCRLDLTNQALLAQPCLPTSP